MARQSNAEHRLAEPSRDLHVNQRQRDGDSCSRGEYFIEIAIAGVVIIARVSVETQLFEEIVIRRGDEVLPRHHAGQALG